MMEGCDERGEVGEVNRRVGIEVAGTGKVTDDLNGILIDIGRRALGVMKDCCLSH